MVVASKKGRRKMALSLPHTFAFSCTVKTFGLLQPYFGHLSCMPVVCVTHYKLQRDASYLNQSLCVIEKLLPQLGSSYRKPIANWLHAWHFHHSHATRHSSRDRCVGSKKHQPHQKCYKPSERRYYNLTKGEASQLHSDSE